MSMSAFLIIITLINDIITNTVDLGNLVVIDVEEEEGLDQDLDLLTSAGFCFVDLTFVFDGDSLIFSKGGCIYLDLLHNFHRIHLN